MSIVTSSKGHQLPCPALEVAHLLDRYCSRGSCTSLSQASLLTVAYTSRSMGYIKSENTHSSSSSSCSASSYSTSSLTHIHKPPQQFHIKIRTFKKATSSERASTQTTSFSNLQIPSPPTILPCRRQKAWLTSSTNLPLKSRTPKRSRITTHNLCPYPYLLSTIGGDVICAAGRIWTLDMRAVVGISSVSCAGGGTHESAVSRRNRVRVYLPLGDTQ